MVLKINLTHHSTINNSLSLASKIETGRTINFIK